MKVLITGGAGFLGQRLAKAFLEADGLKLAGAGKQAMSSLILTDFVTPGSLLMDDARVRFVAGEINTVTEQTPRLVSESDLIVHLAASVSGDCKADLDLGLHSNIDATLGLLQAAPQSSHGIQRFIGEQLVADFTRRGLVDGHNVRLMTVAVRPGKPNGAASGFLSGMVREPLAGLMCVVLSTQLQWGPRSASQPASSQHHRWRNRRSAGTGCRCASRPIAGLEFGCRITSIVGGRPSRFNAQRAHDLGLRADSSVDALLQDYIETLRSTK
jgi:hypothetical protein